MLNNELYDKVLKDPVREGANRLYIVSGYASAAMAFRHLSDIMKITDNCKVELIIGMCCNDGMPISNHKGFIEIVTNDFQGRFVCKYMKELPPVHSKVYSWYKDTEPIAGFIGSANYSQLAFSDKQREAMLNCDAVDCINYFRELEPSSIDCTHPETEEFIKIVNDKYYKVRAEALADTVELDRGASPHLLGLPAVTVSFLDNSRQLPNRSGLNWGQREEYNREPNQAYIRLSSDIYNSDFFPPIGTHFTIFTDDNKILICTRAQANGKAIQTPHNNSLIGEYFRNRLNIPLGSLVTKTHLDLYGRTDVTFYKTEEESYYMDFSV